MNKYKVLLVLTVLVVVLISFKKSETATTYFLNYKNKTEAFKNEQLELLTSIEGSNLDILADREKLKAEIGRVRNKLKTTDFWFRYLDPLQYKKINGPLPVEWETEVFEKFESPYKRQGAGLTLAELYLDESVVEKKVLLQLIQSSLDATDSYKRDSITSELKSADHFFLCNRLFLLNLAAIYTTGFECPDTIKIIPELRQLLLSVSDINKSFNESFPETKLSEEYLSLFQNAIVFVNAQSSNYSAFDHFTFIKEYVNPLFSKNQLFIANYNVLSKSYVDYTLNKTTASIFSKSIYNGQNSKGIFLRVNDEKALAEIDKIGKLLFYDPILSGNNMRSCVSCHNPKEYFTDTTSATSFQYNHKDFLSRNSPSLINAPYNHLIMLDGKHISLQNQTKAVVSNSIEMGSSEKEILEKVLSCEKYKKVFEKLLKYTPQEKEITIDHITSAITFYYGKFSNYAAPFDEAMNGTKEIEKAAKQGFNLFMSKAQCATCHFVPQFNGVKPPFVGSEFEVLGVPKDTTYKVLDSDRGRYEVNPAEETLNAFRTGSIRNASYTKPYMHNGVFTSLLQVIDFYDAGGGQGRGLKVDNQTLSSDSLHLSVDDKANLIRFITSLNEAVQFEEPPVELPLSKNKMLNTRKVGGSY